VNAMIEGDVLGRARQNFRARNHRQDRSWSVEAGLAGHSKLILSDTERAEIVAQARHELEVELRHAVASASENPTQQTQRQG
jgi:hypothetical protein